MKKKKILMYVVVPVVCVVVLVAVVMAALNNAKPSTLTIEGITLEPSSLQTEINATGTVESDESKNVFSTLTYPVKSIPVQVGDKVNAGDVLCVIDSDDLEQQIAQQEATLETSNVTSSYQLAQSEKNYNEAKNNLDNGMNAELRSAETTLKTAELDLKTAQDKYDAAQKSQKTENSDGLITAQNEMNTARINYSAKTSDYQTELSKDLFSDVAAIQAAEQKLASLKTAYQTAKTELLAAQSESAAAAEAAAAKADKAKTAYDNQLQDVYDLIDSNALLAQRKALETYAIAYDDAKAAYDKLASQVGGDLSTYKSTLDGAQVRYDSALASYNASKLSASQQLDSYKADLDKNLAVASNEPQVLQLAALKSKLDQCTITAPISGTVTAVSAKEGSVPSGVLFVIEDTQKLVIKSNIKEYDIGKIAENMKVRISSDATGEDEYEGYVSRVAPTSNKNSTSSGTEFEIEVAVTSAGSKLLIGMSTRLNIITEEKDNALAVRYDSLETDEDGNDFVYIANSNGDGTYTAERVPVTTGQETDFEVEILGDKISVGTIVLADIRNVKDGSVVHLSE